MKVLMPTIYYPFIGGITIHVENLVKHIDDCEFHILTYHSNYNQKYENVVVHKIPYIPKMRGLTYMLNAYKIGREIIRKEKIDLIHSHYAFPQGVVGGLLKGNLPNILTLHGSDVLKLSKSIIGKPFFDYAVGRADKIICVSEFLRNNLGDNFKRKAIVIPNGVDFNLFYGENDLDYGLFVGSFVEQKGLDVLIDAIKDIDFNFKLIGDGPLFNKIKEKIEKENMKHVELLGKKSQIEVAKYMRNCSFLVLPSISEGLGMVLLEAMACGKAVIATNVGGIGEIVKDGYNGFLVPPNNPKILKDKIKILINDKNLREKFGKNGKEFSKNFSWENVAKKVRSIYEECYNNLKDDVYDKGGLYNKTR
ncbi:glycosyltransferase family 4 protein [Methanotorris formicicus]|uniref:Glycosyl transferase group 1 n=1 Tax=Methanotorris formicicus Mc-S-70 TaxID=647171 RepID=H1L151_9EURY|nr:glycosyltransferase family 4 protein [Methanotorris formicicus]EHP84065.1 glycosyl transferase group 1 [Methanotorris formicicus Mc-S-70]